MKKNNPLRSVWRLYYDGFRSMTVGRTLWLIILLKLFFLFAILRLFFFPDHLSALHGDEEKAQFVGSELIDRMNNNQNINR
jgi:hypothetical protein